jgi:DNA-binding CsgD family transcriptional regulator
VTVAELNLKLVGIVISQIRTGPSEYAAVRDLVDVETVGELRPREFLRPVTSFNVLGLRKSTWSVPGVSARGTVRLRLSSLVVSRIARSRSSSFTEATAAKHLENILGKLSFTSRTQVAAWAVTQGLAAAPR